MKHCLPGQWTRILMAALLALQLGACSSTRLSYQFADRGVVWWVEDYVDLTGEQEDALLQDLRQMRQWHCQTQLPRYSHWLAELRRETARGELPPERIRYHRQQVAAFLEPLIARAVPVASRLLKSLTDEQVRELMASMEEQQTEYQREYLDEAPPQEAVERVVERSERWLGGLNDRQVAIIRQWVADREGATEAWLEGRGNWQAAFASLLEQRQQADFEDRLMDMIIHYQRYQGDTDQARAETNADDMIQLTHNLLVAADDRHWRHLQDETRDLRQDMVALACPVEPATAAR